MDFELTSKRLRAVLSAVYPDAPMADIGTDHALLPIAAVLEDVVPRAIGIDKAPKALDFGRAHVDQYGVAARVDLRLGDGLQPLRDEDGVRTVTMCGVGAAALTRALDSPRLAELGVRRLVLQPNRSEIDARQAIFQTAGWRLGDEALVEENDYFYVVFSVELDPSAPALALEDVPLEEQLLGTRLKSAPTGRFQRYATSLLEMLESHLSRADVANMPDQVRERLERRLEIFERAAGTTG